MKHSYFAIAALALAGATVGDANTISLNFGQFPNFFHGFSKDEGAEPVNGMAWGIVVNIHSDSSDFSALQNMDARWLADGISVSGQRIGEDLIYLTSPTPPRTEVVGFGPLTYDGGLSIISEVAGSGTATDGSEYDLDVNKTYSFAVIWFGEDEIKEESRYGYLHIEGFTIPEGNESGERSFNFGYLANANSHRIANQAFIPEPATYALLLGGLALAGCAVRRRRGKTTA